ncbi:MAG: MBOAT family protein [Oscillospiraceae bacterium]|nr:MBOAT family protein [Oscillospiraceae bacterium]
MTFSSFTFLFLFLPILLACYFAVPRRFRQARNVILLVFSLIFYSFGGVKFLLLLLASVCINYTGGILIARERWKKTSLVLALSANLALLVWFKYIGFLAETISALGFSIPIPSVTLPVGISFFTFQGMSYVIDVYRGNTACQRNPLKLALYVALFPQLVAGPIVRYTDIAEKIDADRESPSDFTDGLVRFCFGLAKKMLLANAFGEVADGIFGTEAAILSTSAAWLGGLAYTFQIYFDFSAYSDMAIGLGQVFGFHFNENFNYPYISRSVTEFWRRWHISLSSWFRDYVYIPLGGNRVTTWKHIRNILIVWMLTGLWHGASWNFVLWGLWYGLLLLGEKYLWNRLLDKGPAVLHWLVTMVIVVLGWVLFRAETLDVVVKMFQSLFGFGAGLTSGQTIYYLLEYWPVWICGILACLPIKKWLEGIFREDGFFRVWGVKILALALFAFSYVQLVTGTFNPFLYYRF